MTYFYIFFKIHTEMKSKVNNIMKFIKERTSNRKHQKELIIIIWKQLFGIDAKILGEQFDLGLDI